jgi:hypothetical protein
VAWLHALLQPLPQNWTATRGGGSMDGVQIRGRHAKTVMVQAPFYHPFSRIMWYNVVHGQLDSRHFALLFPVSRALGVCLGWAR